MPRKPPPSPPPPRLTMADLRKHLRVSRESIQAWIRKGMPRERTKTADGKVRSLFDPAAVEKWLTDQGSPRAKDMAGAGVSSSESASSESPVDSLARLKIDLALAELRRRRGQAEKIEHALSVTRGQYLSAAEVEAGRLARIAACKAGLLALPARMGARCANRGPLEVEQFAREEVERLLGEFAGGAP